MLDLASGWVLAVERGPDWLFVRIGNPVRDRLHCPPLKDCLWSLLQEHFTHRLVLEMDEIDFLDSHLTGQLVALYQAISSNGGVLRLCGLSPQNRKILEACHLDERFPVYGSRMDAVLCRGDRCVPCKPK